MALSEITVAAVEATCDEYDRLGKRVFLKKYGFGESRKYELLRDGKRYNSKAIAGVAHGYLGPEYEPMRAQDFSGGEARVVHILEKLGFEIVADRQPVRNPNWSRDELILTTEFYLQHAPRIPGKTSRALINLADEIRASAFLQGLEGNDTFRNPNGVYMKLMELRKYDDSYDGVGLGHKRIRAIELEVWRMPTEDLLLAARSIRKRIQEFIEGGGTVPKTERPLPQSKVLRELLVSDDPLDRAIASVLFSWQEVKREIGRFPGLGREPGEIKKHGAKSVIEKRVRAQSTGFDEVSASGESYEQIVVNHPDRFPNDLVQIAMDRIADFELVKPTSDRSELEKKQRQIADRPQLIGKAPNGNQAPKKELGIVTLTVRDPSVAAYTQQRANGVCELCKQDAPFNRSDGTPYLETHHVIPLAENGPDTPDNCVALCPNCHRAAHSASNRQELAETLKTLVTISTANA